jgi:hypothetical protein
MFNGVFYCQDTSLRLGLISNITILLTHAYHYTLHSNSFCVKMWFSCQRRALYNCYSTFNWLLLHIFITGFPPKIMPLPTFFYLSSAIRHNNKVNCDLQITAQLHWHQFSLQLGIHPSSNSAFISCYECYSSVSQVNLTFAILHFNSCITSS